MPNLFLLIRLFWEFFKTGLFSIGGGLATIPFLIDMSDRTGWFSREQLADMMAVAESTPGPIGVNTATYVGFTTAGIPGGIIATLGLICPSIIIITAISFVLAKFRDSKYVKSSFYFLRPASLSLICAAAYTFILLTLFYEDMPLSFSSINVRACLLAVGIYILMKIVNKKKNLHPVIWIAICAVIGIIIF